MTCSEMDGLLSPYLDGELDLVNSLDVERHLGNCAACSAAVERQRALKSVIQASAPAYAAPASLRRRVVQQRAPSWQWLPVAAMFALGALILWRVDPAMFHPASDPIAQEIVSAHVRSLLADHLMDVPSSDRHTVKPWFTGKLDFAPPVEDLADRGFPLAGGRLDYVDGRTVAALVYQRRKHTINVFLWPSAGKDVNPKLETRQGYNLASWVKGGMRWWAISDVAPNDLSELARDLSGQ